MRLMGLIRGSVVAAASFGLFVPQMAYAANPGTASPNGAPAIPDVATVQDVALQPGGVLCGQILDGQGRPVARSAVVVAQQGKLVTRTQTDDQGGFAVTGLRAGLYQLATAHGGGAYRVWTAEAAPPAAKNAALIVDDATVVRGALGGGQGGFLGFLSNPWVLAGIVAAAIAIPLALDDDDAS